MERIVTLDELYLYFSICLILILLGTSIIYGTWSRVKFFVDPSEQSLFTMSTRLIKGVVGAKGLIAYWYILGGCFLLIGAIGFFMGLKRLLKGLLPPN